AVELGNFSWAASILNQLKDKKAFEYLIRYAKLQDHLGNTEETLKAMEQALLKAEASENNQLLLWAQSNLADMYSHQNKVKEAYKLYKKVLATDPHYYHALRGIAWIAFSYDHNTELAKKILHTLQLHHPVPDYDYLLAEIAAYENNEAQKQFYTTRFLQAVKNPAYGDMYNKYVFEILIEQKELAAKALTIAQTEVNNRPTPQSYDLLAWAYYQSNQLPEALAIANEKVLNKNFEPEALYHLGLIYKQNGNKEKAWNYLNQALNSSFELGPVITDEIKQQLNTL
ncbi:MAG: tetratricopeptide repeat protein, partial [Chitinophagaceae bacterium]